jgi:hypothetical protein
MSSLGIAFAFAGVLLAFVVVGFFLWQRRFWSQNSNRSRTAPPAPEEGVGNRLQESTKNWHPPKSA